MGHRYHKYHHRYHHKYYSPSFSSGWNDLVRAGMVFIISFFLAWFQCNSGFETGSSALNKALGLNDCFIVYGGLIGTINYILGFIIILLIIRGLWRLFTN